jgi:hypothetical protein
MGWRLFVSRVLCNDARHVSAFAFALVAVFVALQASASDEIVRAPSGVTYVTGGVSSESVNQLKSMEKGFNLKLVFADTSGAYLSDVGVRIVDASAHVVLDATSDGPLVMAKLPAGSYRVDATFGGDSKTREITVPASDLVTIDFRWPPS